MEIVLFFCQRYISAWNERYTRSNWLWKDVVSITLLYFAEF